MQQALATDVIDMLRRLVGERDLKSFFEQTADEAARLLGADGAALIEVVDFGDMQYRFFRGMPSAHQKMADGRRFSSVHGTAGAALREGVPIFTADYPNHPNAMPDFVASGLKANLVVPCGPPGDGRAVLAISWFSHYPSAPPDEQSLALIMLLADLMHSSLYRQSLESHLEWQAEHDMLTGLPNRRYLNAYLERLFGASAPREPGSVVALLDLDDFKPINDRYGHSSGDCVLREFALRLNDALQEHDVAGRWGGDEFVLILRTPAASNRSLDEAMNALCDTLDRPYKIADGDWVRCGTSIGVAVDSEPGATSELLLSNADRALYKAKSNKASRYARWERY